MGDVENLPSGSADTSAERMRVTDLADAVGLSVDTVRYYQSLGILSAPLRVGRLALYDEQHLARLKEIRNLREAGWSLNAIAQKDDQVPKNQGPHPSGPVQATPVESIEFYSISELVSKTNVPEAILRALINDDLLRSTKIDGSEYFSDADVRLADAALALLESGIPIAALMTLARSYQDSLSSILDTAVDLFEKCVRQPLYRSGDDEGTESSSQRTLHLFDKLFDAATVLVTAHFQKELLARSLAFIVENGNSSELALISLRTKIPLSTLERN